MNLTIPKAHVAVGLQAVAAGKHVHSEKPLGISTAEASKLSTRRGHVASGSVPHPIPSSAAAIRRPASSSTRAPSARRLRGTAFFMCPGHERWHPNPGFYYLAGGGPMLDMGPYYITDLVNLLGPVPRSRDGVAIRSQRLVTSEPLAGTHVPVEVATHVAGTLAFVSGAIVTSS